MYIGDHEPNSYALTIMDSADPQVSGLVRLTARINYGMGTGVRICDISPEEADALAIQLVRAAHDARRYAARAAHAERMKARAS